MSSANATYQKLNRETIPFIRVGEVVDVYDPKKTGRIKVRIEGIDKGDVTVNSLPYCVPLTPRFLNVMPKLGELVLVFQYEHKKGIKYTEFSSQRFWMGPLISQSNKLNFDPIIDARSVMTGGKFKIPDITLSNTTGVYPNDEDIALQSRGNTDVILKEGQIWLRAGKYKDTEEKNQFNDKDLGYIQVKYGGNELVRTLKDKVISSYVYDKAETLIDVQIDTLNVDNEVLAGNLTPNEYSQSTKNVVRINVSKIKNKSTVFEQDFLNPGFTTRDEAIIAATTAVKPFISGKWKLKSNSDEILKEFGGDLAVKTGVAFFKGNKKEVKKTIKVVKSEVNKGKGGSVINVVGNKINLISHDGPHTFNLTNPEELISTEEQNKINNDAHPLVYGDILVEFLELVKSYVAGHIHNYHGMPATELPNKINVLNFNLDRILNKNINSN
tara:strand:+ start:6336 stop:7658 length:1323 start_codon:yes stop_codon:yes gene_type:complete